MQAQTNVYHPLPENAIWRIDQHYYDPFQNPCSFWYYYQFESAGDTLIDGSTCRKINRSISEAENIFCGAVQPIAPGNSGYVGALEELPDSNKVYFYPASGSTKYLLFDYNMEVGDTLWSWVTLPDTFVVTIQDSISINGLYHKRWFFNPTPMNEIPYLIEGIGTRMGLINPFWSYYSDFTTRYLVCVKDDEQTLFQSAFGNAESCNWTPSDQTEFTDDVRVHIYPNPCSNFLEIETGRIMKNLKLQLYNSTGQVALEESYSGINKIKIPVNDYVQGVYYLKIFTGTSSIVKRVMIQY